MKELSRHVPVNELRQYCDPFKSPVWRGLSEPLKHDEIERCVRKGEFLDPTEEGDFEINIMDPFDEPVARQEHLERVAWFVEHPIKDPIVVDVGLKQGPPSHWMIQDGNHRWAAALHKGHQEIEVSFGGALKNIKLLFPSITDEDLT